MHRLAWGADCPVGQVEAADAAAANPELVRAGRQAGRDEEIARSTATVTILCEQDAGCRVQLDRRVERVGTTDAIRREA